MAKMQKDLISIFERWEWLYRIASVLLAVPGLFLLKAFKNSLKNSTPRLFLARSFDSA